MFISFHTHKPFIRMPARPCSNHLKHNPYSHRESWEPLQVSCRGHVSWVYSILSILLNRHLITLGPVKSLNMLTVYGMIRLRGGLPSISLTKLFHCLTKAVNSPPEEDQSIVWDSVHMPLCECQFRFRDTDSCNHFFWFHFCHSSLWDTAVHWGPCVSKAICNNPYRGFNMKCGNGHSDTPKWP